MQIVPGIFSDCFEILCPLAIGFTLLNLLIQNSWQSSLFYDLVKLNKYLSNIVLCKLWCTIFIGRFTTVVKIRLLRGMQIRTIYRSKRSNLWWHEYLILICCGRCATSTKNVLSRIQRKWRVDFTTENHIITSSHQPHKFTNNPKTNSCNIFAF